MKKIVVNQNTLNLAQKEIILAFKETYLLLQKYLLHCLEWAGKDLEKKQEIGGRIKEVGEAYKEVIKELKG